MRKLQALAVLVVVLFCAGCATDNRIENGIASNASMAKAAARDFQAVKADGAPAMTTEEVQKYLDLNAEAWLTLAVYFDLTGIPASWETGGGQ